LNRGWGNSGGDEVIVQVHIVIGIFKPRVPNIQTQISLDSLLWKRESDKSPPALDIPSSISCGVFVLHPPQKIAKCELGIITVRVIAASRKAEGDHLSSGVQDQLGQHSGTLSLKKYTARHQWLMLVIQATQEAEIRRITV
jgi:hypothetical protein